MSIILFIFVIYKSRLLEFEFLPVESPIGDLASTKSSLAYLGVDLGSEM